MTVASTEVETPGRSYTAEELRDLARRGAEELGPDANAEAVLDWAARTFGHGLIAASNMQDAVLVDLAAIKEQEFKVMDQEAQRCREMISRQPNPARKKSGK